MMRTVFPHQVAARLIPTGNIKRSLVEEDMVMKLANRSSEIQYVARTINPRRFSQKEKQSSRQRDRHGDQPADRQLLNRFQLFFKKKKRKTADKQPGRRVLLHASVFLFLLRSKIGEIEERPRRLHQMQIHLPRDDGVKPIRREYDECERSISRKLFLVPHPVV